MLTLALDVDGVLLDSDRGGAGHWTNELNRRFGIERSQLRETFFMRHWDDVVNGRRPIEGALADSLRQIGTDADHEQVLACWFDADYVPVEPAFDLARRALDAGVRVVLATNQEHRRAAYLRARVGETVALDDVFYSADLGHQKHEPRFFELTSERLVLNNSDRTSVVFVDAVENNVDVARSCGWRAIHAEVDGAGFTKPRRCSDSGTDCPSYLCTDPT